MIRKKLSLEEISNILNDAVFKYADDSPHNLAVQKEKNYWEDIKYKIELFKNIRDIKKVSEKRKNITITSLCFKTTKRPTRTVLSNLKSYGFIYSKNNPKNKKEQEYYFSCELKK